MTDNNKRAYLEPGYRDQPGSRSVVDASPAGHTREDAEVALARLRVAPDAPVRSEPGVLQGPVTPGVAVPPQNLVTGSVVEVVARPVVVVGVFR